MCCGKCNAYNDGKEAGEQNKYSEQSISDVFIEAVTGAHNPPVFSGYTKEEEREWRRGYERGKNSK